MELWFTEQEHDNVRMSWRTDEVLFRGRSEFQTVEVIQTQAYGRMLALDGCVMLTETDEFVYHELIAHIPALHHAAPRRALVIGGGDGGTVRELLRHPGIKEVVLCEIDGLVVETCRKFFPAVAGSLGDERVSIALRDGVQLMAESTAEYDLVVIDSTDPVGPGEGLFSRDFYRSVARALKPGGIMVAQSESPWFPKELLGRIQRNIGAGFAYRYPYIGAIPTYPRGLWSWTMASAAPLELANFDQQRLSKLSGLRYLTPELMTAAFALPAFFAEKLAVL